MTWQPNYRRDLKRRLTAAADCVRENPTSRQHVEHAISACLGAFHSEQFPADFRAQFEELMAVGLAVNDMTDDELAATIEKIIELQRDVLG